MAPVHLLAGGCGFGWVNNAPATLSRPCAQVLHTSAFLFCFIVYDDDDDDADDDDDDADDQDDDYYVASSRENRSVSTQ